MFYGSGTVALTSSPWVTRARQASGQTLSPVHTVAEKWDCRRKRRQSYFSATASLFSDSLTFLRQCGQGFMATILKVWRHIRTDLISPHILLFFLFLSFLFGRRSSNKSRSIARRTARCRYKFRTLGSRRDYVICWSHSATPSNQTIQSGLRMDTRRWHEEGRTTKEDMARHTERRFGHIGCWLEWCERYCQRSCQMETTRRPMFCSEREELSLSLNTCI